jgi:hypothetical protein
MRSDQGGGAVTICSRYYFSPVFFFSSVFWREKKAGGTVTMDKQAGKAGSTFPNGFTSAKIRTRARAPKCSVSIIQKKKPPAIEQDLEQKTHSPSATAHITSLTIVRWFYFFTEGAEQRRQLPGQVREQACRRQKRTRWRWHRRTWWWMGSWSPSRRRRRSWRPSRRRGR